MTPSTRKYLEDRLDNLTDDLPDALADGSYETAADIADEISEIADALNDEAVAEQETEQDIIPEADPLTLTDKQHLENLFAGIAARTGKFDLTPSAYPPNWLSVLIHGESGAVHGGGSTLVQFEFEQGSDRLVNVKSSHYSAL